jgi:resuscitation-promoting factor RpfB
MARYRVFPRRLRRRLRGRNGRLAGPAVAAGLVLAVIAGHAHSPASGGAQTSVIGSSNVALGQRLAGRYGWGAGPQWACLDELWTRESGWSQYADTRKTGLDPRGAAVYAHGIPQARPAAKMAAAGPDYMTDPATQIRWGLGYIASAYGTPCGAWSHETRDGWY